MGKPVESDIEGEADERPAVEAGAAAVVECDIDVSCEGRLRREGRREVAAAESTVAGEAEGRGWVVGTVVVGVKDAAAVFEE